MARLGRYNVVGVPQHIIQRGINRAAIFADDADRARFLGWLGEAAAANGLAIHAYVLMSNHFHLVATQLRADAIPRSLQSLGRRYVAHVNRRHRRSGTLWQGRYRAVPIESEAYLLGCMRYVECNPVRARMSRRAVAYRWSSARANAEGAADALITPHAVYEALGRSRAARLAAYAGLLDERLDRGALDDIRKRTQGGWAIGGADFLKRIGAKAGRRAAIGRRGRPKLKRHARRRKRIGV